MLGFQNLHQLVFNLSQVTSAITSAYSRVSFTSSVKQKPEIDVFCHESFVHFLRKFQQSENMKLFDHLPAMKFGPRFEDVQWIYTDDFNFKLRAKESVKKNDLIISFEEKTIKCLQQENALSNLSLLTLESHKKLKSKQEKILAHLENKYMKKPNQFNDSFVSNDNFDQNKESAVCYSQENSKKYQSISPATCSILGCFKLANSFQNSFEIQKRGFKTKRHIETKEPSKGFFSKLGKSDEDLEKNYVLIPTDSKTRKYLDIVGDESLSPQDQLKLKVSFAEGYIMAANEFKKNTPTTLHNKMLSAAKSILLFLACIVVSTALISFASRRIIVRFNLGHHGEVDPEEVGVTFSDVKGVEEVKEELQEIVEFLKNPEKFSSMGGKLPKGILLVGPPGTGKTLLARAVAGEANVPFFHASGSEFDEIFVGEGARRVRNLFKSAKAKAPAIIFIDEIDCVGSKRRSTMVHPYANQTINQLLSEMDGFAKNEGVIVLGATNRKSDLDAALLRPGRFDVEVLVPLPDLESRKQILELYISKIISKDIDIEKIAKSTAGMTGADLEAVINHAAIRAATEGASYVSMDHIENAKDKILMGPERKSAVRDDENNLITAYHEGGHTVVAYFSEGVGLVDKVTIVPRGKSLGHTSVVPEADDKYFTKAMCLAKMDILLGGRAAEEIIFGVNKITANASDDLDKATYLATKMVKNFGMSEKIGLRTLKSSKGELVTFNEFGQSVNDQVDTEVKRLIQESYERAKAILKKHAREHKLLAEALIRYKTLSPEDVRAILGDNSAEKGSGAGATN